MLNLVQHLTKSWTYETLKQVQGDRYRLFTKPTILDFFSNSPQISFFDLRICGQFFA
jgi:hypothetical protein